MPEDSAHPEGNWVEWDGSVSFWGVKRMIMSLFRENKDEQFSGYPEAVRKKVAEFNPADYTK